MTSDYLWYIIPRDGAYPWESEGTLAVDFDYLKHLATGVDRLGFSGALLATDIHDVWVLGSALAAHTKKLRPLLAVHPGLISPTLLAKMALTFDDLFDGRLQINVVNGETRTLRQYGLDVEHDERYALAGEYWEIFRRLTSGEVVDFEGRHFSVRGAGSSFGLPVVQKPHVPLWFGGSSEAGMQMAAKHIDRYLSWGWPPSRVAYKIARLNELAEGHGPTIGYGMRLHLVVRDTEQEAWDHVDRLLKATSEGTFAGMAASNAGTDSVGMRRQFEKHQGKVPDRAKDLESYPNIWPGMSLLRPRPGTALVGSTEQVVERIQEFEALGVAPCILPGTPLRGEAYGVSETVLPRLGVRPAKSARRRDHQAIVDVPVTAG